MGGSILALCHIFTANIVFKGFVAGLSFSLVAMGIVLVYRSSRIINFAVGDLGVPASALLGLYVAKSHWPYWPALAFAIIVGTLSGTIVELAIIRRLFKAPRVIVLVATIGIAELARAITYEIPQYRTGKFQQQYPSPINGEWKLGSIDITGPQLSVLIVVPIIALGLWWLLGHTRFADSVRASATNADLARLTGISPKLMSTAIWSIAGFLSTMSVILYATQQGSTELITVGPDTLLAGLTAALIGRMQSFPRAAIGGIAIGIVRQVLFYNFFSPSESGLTQFLLFIVVLVLVARMSRADDTGGESFSFAPRVPPVPDRLRQIWWVRRMPQLVAGVALVVAIIVPFFVSQSEHHQTYTSILAFAICAVSVTVLTGWGGQLSLGQMAFAGIAALSAAAFVRGVTLNVGFRSQRLIAGSLRPVPFCLALSALILGATAIGFALELEPIAAYAPAAGRWCSPLRGDRRGAVPDRDRPEWQPTLGAVRRRSADGCHRRVRRRGRTRHRRAPGEGLAARDQHDGVRDRGAGVHLPAADPRPRRHQPRRAATRQARTDRSHVPQSRVLLVRARRAGDRVDPRRAPAPHRRRPDDHRRARERGRRVRVHDLPDTHQADCLRARWIRRRSGRRADRRPDRDDQLHAAVLPLQRLAPAGVDRRDRWARQSRRRRHRRAVGHRSSRVLAEQPVDPVVHVEHRATDHPVVHPRRLHADRLLAARLDPAVARATAPRAGRQEGDSAARVVAPRRDCRAHDQRRRERARDSVRSRCDSVGSSPSTRSTSKRATARSLG